MKKNNESFAAGKYDTSEVSRRLYRGALDAARRLEEFMRGNPHPDVLGPDVTALRMRLKDYCERLLFSDSQDFSRKAEELLWRKVYYEPLQMHKQKRKTATGGLSESNDLLCGWLRAGVGHYQHLLLRLQAEFQLPEHSILAPQCPWRHRGLRKERWSRHQRSVCVRGQEEWATQTAHRCLMCLGDLSRYLSECGDPGSVHLSERYYRQAFLLIPSLGMPYNQMGTLAALDQHNGCHALYFYLRCLLSPQSFEGAEGNIQRVFEKNQPLYEDISVCSETEEEKIQIPVHRRMCIRFLKLAELFHKQQENMLASLCQEVLQDLDLFLTSNEVVPPKNCPNSAAISAEDEPEMEEDHSGLLTFRLGIIALMSFSRLQSQGSPLVSAAAAFVLSFLSQVVRHCLIHLRAAFFLDSDQMSNCTTISPPPTNSLTVNGTVSPAPEKEQSWSPQVEEDGTRTRSTSGTLTPIAAANGALSDEAASNQSKSNVDQCETKRSSSALSGHHKKHSSLLGQLRRRRRRNTSSTSQDDSEVSNEEGDFCESDVDNGITSDISETGSNHGSEGSLTEQEEEEEGKVITISPTDNLPFVASTEDNVQDCDNGSPCSDIIVTHRSHHQLKRWETLEILKQEAFLLALIKVLSQWLSSHPDILTACAQSTHSLWKHFAELLNVLIKAESSLLNTEEAFSSHLSVLKCPRPSPEASNKTESVDNVNNNNSHNQKSSADQEVVSAIVQWSWSGLLPEDVELQHSPFLVPPQQNKTNSSQRNNTARIKTVLGSSGDTPIKNSAEQTTKCEQLIGRIQCLLQFGFLHAFPRQQLKIQGNYLGKNGCMKNPKSDSPDQLFTFDPVDNVFTIFEPTPDDQTKPEQNKMSKKNNNEITSADDQDPSNDLEGQRKQLMRNMAHLWLKAEVQDLEGRTGHARGGKGRNHSGPGNRHIHYAPGGRQGGLQGGCLPPYLVPDTGALCHQLPALKQLQAARRFIIILPSSVISSLDELKRQSAYAREAIRWIEAELRAGSRFLRPQKSQERLSLVPMKYPKRKEKEAWDFFQVLECCHFLNKNHGHGRASGASLVTLVTGGNQFLPPNAAAVASSAGVSMESVEDFLIKWRNSLKS